MEIPKNVQEEIQYYCKINDIEDVDKFLMKILRNGFNLAKYGNGPKTIVIAPKETLEIDPITEPLKAIEPVHVKIAKQIEKIIEEPKQVEQKKKDLYDEE